MRAVLGIDAAWTLTQPSGVALACGSPGNWRLIAVASSYHRFLASADLELKENEPALGGAPNVALLLAASSMLCGHSVDLVAVDMPLARSPILRRRAADKAVSKAYGARKCGTHTPSKLRPGPISDTLRGDLELAGYPLLTVGPAVRGAIEVYPHPALVELAETNERLKYKAAKTNQYWPGLVSADRRANLFEQWNKIIDLLQKEITGVEMVLPKMVLEAGGREVKAFEDALDAIVCAWIGICALEGRASPFGDADSAIWIPNPRNGKCRM
jgi:predicted RNase H-like nuclease